MKTQFYLFITLISLALTTSACSLSPVVVAAATPAPVLLFKEDFSGDRGYLGAFQERGGYSRYRNGVYNLVVSGNHNVVWGVVLNSALREAQLIPAITPVDFEAVSLEVEATHVSGPANGQYGLVCRFQDWGNFIALLVSGDGRHYAIYQSRGNLKVHTEWVFVGGQTQGEPHPAIKTGPGATNLLRADCTDETIALFINGERLVVAPTPGDSQAGDVALLAQRSDNGAANLEVAFDNLAVYIASSPTTRSEAPAATPPPIPPTATPTPISSTATPLLISSPTATLEPDEIIASKVEDMIGVWTTRFGPLGEDAFIEYKLDGTWVIAANIPELYTKPALSGTFWFEGTRFTTEDKLCGPGTYEVRLKTKGKWHLQLTFLRLKDSCSPRVRNLSQGMGWINWHY